MVASLGLIERATAAIQRHALVAVVVVMLFTMAPANAQMLRCASHHLAPGERDEVLGLARHVAPGNAGLLSLKSACWNHDFAIAWLRTPTVVDPEGVSSWLAVRCDRKTRSWSCDTVTRERRVEVAISDTVPAVRIVSSLPDDMSGAWARSVIIATASLAMKMEMPLSACSTSIGDRNTWRESRFDPPAPDLEYPAADISFIHGGLTIDYGRLRFDLGPNDRPICWDELIIVT